MSEGEYCYTPLNGCRDFDYDAGEPSLHQCNDSDEWTSEPCDNGDAPAPTCDPGVATIQFGPWRGSPMYYADKSSCCETVCAKYSGGYGDCPCSSSSGPGLAPGLAPAPVPGLLPNSVPGLAPSPDLGPLPDRSHRHTHGHRYEYYPPSESSDSRTAPPLWDVPPTSARLPTPRFPGLPGGRPEAPRGRSGSPPASWRQHAGRRHGV